MMVVAATKTSWNICWFYKNCLKSLYSAYFWDNFYTAMHLVRIHTPSVELRRKMFHLLHQLYWRATSIAEVKWVASYTGGYQLKSQPEGALHKWGSLYFSSISPINYNTLPQFRPWLLLPHTFNSLFTYYHITQSYAIQGDRGGTAVKVLCYKSEGHWFDSRWCHWNFSLT